MASTPRRRILVVEDDERLAALIAARLRHDGHEAAVATTPGQALALQESFNPALVLLDLLLPGGDGLSLLAALRARRGDVPILIASARRDVETRLAALRGGASDFLTKPFALDELVERVAIHLRYQARPDAERVVRLGPFLVDRRTREVDAGGPHGRVRLTEREFHLLEQLARNPGEVVSRERLLSAVWAYSFTPGTNVLEVYVRRLRAKLGADSVETVRGHGYRLTV